MPPRQRIASAAAGGDSARVSAGHKQRAKTDTGAKRRPGACARCRLQKVKCEVLPGTQACRKCIQSGLSDECELQESITHSVGGAKVPSGKPQVAQDERRSRAIPPSQPKASTKGKQLLKKTGPSQKRCMSRPTSRAAVAPQLDLYAISEHDDAYDSMALDDRNDDTDSSFPPDILKDADQLLSVMTVGTSESEYMEVDEELSEPSKKMGLDSQVISDDGEKSDSELDNLLKQCRPSKPAASQARSKQKKQINEIVDTSDDSDSDAHQLFTIQCSASRPDGSNAPFKILSTITLNTLRDLVAEKMERHPKVVRLQYRLDSDKAKQGSTSIHSNDELDMFIGRLQSIIMPGRLPSGRKSTRAPKNPIVQFEDASIGGNGPPHTNKGGGKASGAIPSTIKQKAVSTIQSELSGANRRRDLIKELQERWKCEVHSKGSDTKWCYSPSGGDICQPLTIGNLSFWAIQIMEDQATLDEKPLSLNLKTVHSGSRSSSNQQTGMPMGQPVFPGGYGYTGHPPPVFILPQWGMGPQGAGPYWQPQTQTFSQGTGPSGLQPVGSVQSGLAPIPQNAIRSVSPAPIRSIPDIIKWFSYLDTCIERNQGGTIYSAFGPLLHAKGLSHLNHLNLKYLQLSDLQDWLGIEAGTAIDIIEYAEEDLEAAKAGRLVLPD